MTDEIQMKKNYAYRLGHFTYNGICGTPLKGIAQYSATFKARTNDPGIGLFECSDGIDRLIPSFALKGLKQHPLPKQNMSNKIFFGPPSRS